MGRIPDWMNYEKPASDPDSEDEPPTRKIKGPFPDQVPHKPRLPGSLHDLERAEDAIFKDDKPKT